MVRAMPSRDLDRCAEAGPPAGPATHLAERLSRPAVSPPRAQLRGPAGV